MSSVPASGQSGIFVRFRALGLTRFLELGGVVAGVILIAFGVAAIVLSVGGHNTVVKELKQQYITGSSDMTPATIKADAAQAGLKDVSLPTCNVADKPIDTGSEARCFAEYMRVHALESSGGLTYSQMGRYATPDGKAIGTNDAAKALKDAKGSPVANGARDTWVTETALSTALNTSYMAEQIARFGVVVGIALLLSGIGFTILAVGGALRHRK
jgi:hypothetical protein